MYNGGSLISPVVGLINAIGMLTTIKIRIIVRYLSTECFSYKTIYLFDLGRGVEKHDKNA